MTHSLTNVKVSRDDSAWEAEVRAELPAAALSKYFDEALKNIQREASLDGFRKGHAPREKILQIYGEEAVLRRAAEAALQHELPELLAAEKLFVIDTPRVTTERLAKDTALSFTARAPLMPTVELADYKKIAAARNAKKESVSVTDEEHKEAMLGLRRERARIDRIEAGTEPQKASEEARALKDEELPGLDDQFVQSLGYENAEKFSDALRANIKTEKEMRSREKHRAALLEELTKASKVSFPALLREQELDEMEARVKNDLERSGVTWEHYLQETKKNAADIRASWKGAAESRAKVRLILTEIARKENLEPDQKELEAELAHAKEHYPDANPEPLRAHIAHAMRNEKALQLLESIS